MGRLLQALLADSQAAPVATVATVATNRPSVASVASVASPAASENDWTWPDMATLLAAAMRACDYWKDDDAARQAMRDDCLATPPHLRAELLAHFERHY